MVESGKKKFNMDIICLQSNFNFGVWNNCTVDIMVLAPIRSVAFGDHFIRKSDADVYSNYCTNHYFLNSSSIYEIEEYLAFIYHKTKILQPKIIAIAE